MSELETPEAMRQRITDLKLEHHDLDVAITQLADNLAVNQLQLIRMKKRKLQLKDAIRRLESRLIPDLDA